MDKQAGFQIAGPRAKSATWMLRAILLLIGFTAVIAQIVLMRELLVVFYGNELSLGVMLANWLLWTALEASVLGRWAARTGNPRKFLAGLQMLLAFALPLTLLAVRASRLLFKPVPGEILGPGPMFLTSFATLSILCLVSGGLFAAGSRCLAELTESTMAAATGAVYLLEAAGSGLGGALASLFLVRLLTPFETAAILGLLNLLAAAALLVQAGGGRRRLATGFAGLGALLLIMSVSIGPWSQGLLWRGFHLLATRNSVYGSLAVAESAPSRSLFENGLLVMTVPDLAAAEEAVHYALLEHPEPRSLLLIGGGLNGSIDQAFAHASMERVDYVELDTMVFDLAARYFPEEWDKAHHDPRLRIHILDGRRFLKSTSDIFDVIIVNLPDPHTAQLNRFYTEEFFREAAAKLRPGGILSFQVTSSENYISQELADYLRCLNRTLRSVFPDVVAIPGETVHFFAAAKPGNLTSDPAELVRRMRARHLHTQYVRADLVPFRMSRDRMLDFKLQIEPLPSTPVNRDFTPVAYYFDVALWSTRFHRTSASWMERWADVSFARWLAGTTLALAALLPWLWMWPGGAEGKPAARVRRAAALAVAAMGFTGLGLEIMLLLGFQALFGYVYFQLTILVTLFMAGMALGAWLQLRSARGHGFLPPPAPNPCHLRHELSLIAGLQIVASAAPLMLYALLTELGRINSMAGQRLASQGLFPILALASGMLGGYQFLLASRVYFGVPGDSPGPGDGCGSVGVQSGPVDFVVAPPAAHSPGVLYGLDLAGACIGALALTVLLIPLYGFLQTAVLMAAVNLAPALLATAAGRGQGGGAIRPAKHPAEHGAP